MSKKSTLILVIILVVVLMGGGVFVYGSKKGWFGSSASSLWPTSTSSYRPSSSSRLSPTPTKPCFGSIHGKIYLAGKVYSGSSNIFLSDSNGSWKGEIQGAKGEFYFNNLYPGSNYVVTVYAGGCNSGFCWGSNRVGRVDCNKTTDVQINLNQSYPGK